MMNEAVQHREKTFAEFFAGIGLMRMGLEDRGWAVKFANDIDPVKEKMYHHQFGDRDNHFYLGDIHKIRADSVPSVSLATASFPCTDLSLAGRREGLKGKQSSAFWGFIRILEDMKNRRPPLVLLENVEGFLTSNKGADFREALVALNSLGYSVDAFVINAWHFVPQSRVRLFVVGKQLSSPSRVNLQPLEIQENEVRPKKLVDFILNHPNIDWNIRKLPPLPELSITLSDIVDSDLDDATSWWEQDRVDYLLNQTSSRHSKIIEELKDQPHFSYLTAFRRVRNGKSMAEIRNDGIAGCLRTPKGGSARQILLKVGLGEVKVRHISPTESARLMGADEFRISGTTTESLFGFGDAVCVPVISWIAENYLNPLLLESRGVRKQAVQQL